MCLAVSVCVDKIAMPRLAVKGSLWAQDPSADPVAILPSTASSVLTGTGPDGIPVFREFQDLLDEADIPDTSLSAVNQTLTENRQVSVQGNVLTITSLSNFAALSVDGLTRRVVASSTAVDGRITRMELRGTSLDIDLRENATIRLTSPGQGLTSGGSGMALCSKGPLASPQWDFPAVVLTSANGNTWRLYVNDDGTLRTERVGISGFEPPDPGSSSYTFDSTTSPTFDSTVGPTFDSTPDI
jgi:hypothetical protein